MFGMNKNKRVSHWDLYLSRTKSRKARAASQNIQLRQLPEGYLFKQGSMRKSWKKRWFVIDYPQEATTPTPTTSTDAAGTTAPSPTPAPPKTDVRRRLLYFSSKGGDLKGEFTLDDTIIRIDDDSNRAYAFSLVSAQKTLYLQASSDEERERWACELDRNHRMQTERKKFAEAVSLLSDGQWFYNGTDTLQKNFVTLNASKDAITCRSEHSTVPQDIIPLDDLHSVEIRTDATIAAETGMVDTVLEMVFCHESKSLMRRTAMGSFRSLRKGFMRQTSQGPEDNKESSSKSCITERRSDGKRVWTFKSTDLEIVHLYHLALIDVVQMIAHDKDHGRRSVTFDTADVAGLAGLEDKDGGGGGGGGGGGNGGGNGGGSNGGGSSGISGGDGNTHGATTTNQDATTATQEKNTDASKYLEQQEEQEEEQPQTTTLRTTTKRAKGKSAKNAQNDFIGPCLSHAVQQYLAEEATAKTIKDNQPGLLSPLTTEDFQAKTKLTSFLEIHGSRGSEENGRTATEKSERKDYDFRAYAPKVFHRMRQLAGIANSDFSASMASLSGGAVGEGKSGMVFFRSKDGRFIIKTLKESEKNFFYHKGVLAAYYKYMESHPNTLLCSFYGLFKIRFGHKK
jgi:hypothetical protein